LLSLSLSLFRRPCTLSPSLTRFFSVQLDNNDELAVPPPPSLRSTKADISPASSSYSQNNTDYAYNEDYDSTVNSTISVEDPLRKNTMTAPDVCKSPRRRSSKLGLEDIKCGERKNPNLVRIEVPLGKPIEEVYQGVHDGQVLGSGVSGIVRRVTHRATQVDYAVKCLDLALIDSDAGLRQLKEEIYIMCQLVRVGEE
jgi:hypothetical protein